MKKLLVLFYLFLSLAFAQSLRAQEGTLDNSFIIGNGANGTINATAIQSDGKILVGGNFTIYKSSPINRIARINIDGSLDNTFDIITGFNALVNTIAIQSDGKILVGGSFSNYNTIPCKKIIRLKSDGTIDNTFNMGIELNDLVNKLVVQNDGKILVGGMFTSHDGINCNYIVRLNSNGSLDNSFNIGSGFDGVVNSLAIQDDGNILVGGQFTHYNGSSSKYLARIDSNGNLDNTFTIGTNLNAAVLSIAIQKNNKILIGGAFTSYNGITRNKIARLNDDGSLDNSFAQSSTGFNGNVWSLAMQYDGKIVVGGWFTNYNSIQRNSLARLNNDGSLDNSFFQTGSGFNSPILSLSIHNDGNIILGGTFTTYDGASQYRIARVFGASTKPTLSTASISDITLNSAISGGNITDQGPSPVSARGIVWSATANPSLISNEAGHSLDGSGIGTFTSAITGLTHSTLYYVRAYATNSYITAYGNEQVFTTVPTLPEWGLIFMGACIASFGAFFVYKNLY